MKPQISESLIDCVLERALIENRNAAIACLAAAAPAAGEIAFDRVTVARQVKHRDTTGSADLVARYFRGDTATAMILIENKIDAGFTPDQPTRYRICRDAHRRMASAPLVATLLVSPAVYLSGSRLKDGFDSCISYEALTPFVSVEDRTLIKTAIERAESPYEPVPDEAVMNFFEGYSAIARTFAPDLKIKRNPNSADARPEASRTIYFDAKASSVRLYPFLLKGERSASVRMSHQCWDSGAPNPSVKLMLDGWARHLSVVAPILQPSLRNSGIYLRPAGRSLALVSETRRLDNKMPAFDQAEIIKDALSKLKRIREVWNSMEVPLQLAAKAVSDRP